MHETFVLREAIRFGDVDSAKILFYPRLFEYCHLGLERFAGAAFGFTYAELLNDRKLGFPTVHIDADYRKPLAYGDVLELCVHVERLGRKSLVLAFRGFAVGDPELRVSAEITKVCVDMRDFKGVEIPSDLREALSRYHRTSV